jgi:hypothetical protein
MQRLRRATGPSSRPRPRSAATGAPDDFESWAAAYGGPVRLDATDYATSPPPAIGSGRAAAAAATAAAAAAGEASLREESLVLDFDAWVAVRDVRAETAHERSMRADPWALRDGGGGSGHRGGRRGGAAPASPVARPRLQQRQRRPVRGVDDMLAEEPDVAAAAGIAVDAAFHDVLPEWEGEATPRPVPAYAAGFDYRGPPSWVEFDARPRVLSVGQQATTSHAGIGGGGGGGGGRTGASPGGRGRGRDRPASAPAVAARPVMTTQAAFASSSALAATVGMGCSPGADGCGGGGGGGVAPRTLARPASAAARHTVARPTSGLPRPPQPQRRPASAALPRPPPPPPSLSRAATTSRAGLYTVVSTAARTRLVEEAAARAMARELAAAREAAQVLPTAQQQARMYRQQQERRLRDAWREFR